jgi:hypothetical protein
MAPSWKSSLKIVAALAVRLANDKTNTRTRAKRSTGQLFMCRPRATIMEHSIGAARAATSILRRACPKE